MWTALTILIENAQANIKTKPGKDAGYGNRRKVSG